MTCYHRTHYVPQLQSIAVYPYAGREHGYSFIQVKTVQEGHYMEEYYMPSLWLCWMFPEVVIFTLSRA